jgi:uncharacterized membrane protein YdjX (TVP38/TMEM64 family)
MKKNNIKKAIFFISIVTTIFIISQIFGIHKGFNALKEIVEHTGIFGMFIFSVIFALAVLFSAPISLLTIATSSLFGISKGIIISSISATLGAGLAFLAARYFVRGFVFDFLSKNEKIHDKFQKLNDYTIKRGDFVVAIIRLIPFFPGNVMNYGFGLTKISFWTYFFWTWLCMLPEIAMLSLGTHTVMKILLDKKIPWLHLNIFLIIGIILFLIVKKVRRKILF